MRILVICSGGMSTSMLVNSMKKAADAKKIPVTIESGSVSGLAKMIDNCDIIMVAPQVRHRIDEIKGLADKDNKSVVIIKPEIYGLINGEGALKQATDALSGN
jgi:PTS system cellobiose-specific IIB component